LDSKAIPLGRDGRKTRTEDKRRQWTMRDTLDVELEALHDLQSACQVVLRDVPHQKGCRFHNWERYGSMIRARVYRENCSCIRKMAADLKRTLANQLDSNEIVTATTPDKMEFAYLMAKHAPNVDVMHKNAALIAAAPDLFVTLSEELKALRVWLSADFATKKENADVVDGMFASIEKIKLALAKCERR
jgi:hypothetical protein